MNNYDPTKHNYVRKMLAMQAEQPLNTGLYITHISHDDWCNIFNGGYCNCDPEITTEKTPDDPLFPGKTGRKM